MTEIFTMPDIGEGMAEGDITSWLVKVGDVVAMDDPVAEVQNDKLLQEILSPYAGKVTHLYVDAGTTVEVGDPLIEFDGSGTPDTGSDEKTVVETTAPSSEDEVPLVTSDDTTQMVKVANGHVLAMPSVRHLAFEKGIDLTTVTPTGRHGHVTLSDVESFNKENVSESQAVAPVEVATQQGTKPNDITPKAPEVLHEGRQPMTPTRRAIAKAMGAQNATIPSVTNFDSVEVSKLVAHRSSFKAQAQADGVRLTYLAYAVKALAATAKKFPEINASVDMDTNEIIYHEDVNMGIAVNAPSGLYVPVIMHADQKSILTIAKEIVELSEAVREGSITSQQMRGSTITISNLGSARGTWFTPIINGKEVAILGLGTIVKEPMIDENDDIVVGQNMKLSLSYDHRLIDGMLGQAALNYLKQLLADPAYMLMEV
ncbi:MULTISPECIES: 2-oxo acid dehydrogenase subunit E2 [Leuconostoc]|uniref:Dihydrolipoamide acetyltransferase component of pyruvate dehydrogenase complex n=2 Tax=Leuconostoc kimchii TaxID=136609 RepID=D5T1I2_LEUKI|nr:MULTISPECIES: 2-oxo acid dehydrogenase subunit E2 [Leuconostoc]ADG40131.1 dihydrolipoamide acetyltransferase component of PDH complex [Leuconostoc kimchii IMSNU 11154]AEJ30071.1 dihydrolipoamide acetyltransferase component of PDH complex [Leuconostoc sp. C2]QBR47164.1 dienelactone hydrolase [Leuconostoc kimchii]